MSSVEVYSEKDKGQGDKGQGRAGLGKLLRQSDDPRRVLASEDCLITSGKDIAQHYCSHSQRIPPTGIRQVKLHT